MIHNDDTVVKGFLSDLCFWDRPCTVASQAQNKQHSAEDTDGDGCSRSLAQQDQNPSSQVSLASSNASSSGSPSTKCKLPRDCRELRWQSAVDPATGSTYYYDSVTRETQWTKVSSPKYKSHFLLECFAAVSHA